MSEIEVALLLRLIETGECKGSARAAALLERFRLAQWVEPARRPGYWKVRPGASKGLQTRIAELSPSWKEDAQLLRANSLDPLAPRSHQALAGLKAEHRPTGQLHRKTWNSATAAGSKRASQLPTTAQLTDDWAVRGRVNCATELITPLGPVDLLMLSQTLSEFSIAQRGWVAASGFGGVLPRHVLTVENLSPLVDLVLPSDTMVLFCQGAAVEGAVQLLRALPSAAWMHFGDLDGAGVQIAVRIAQLTNRLPSLYVPTFASDYLQRKLRAKCTWSCSPFDTPILKTLSEKSDWLEQEIFILDERLPKDIALAFSAQKESSLAENRKLKPSSKPAPDEAQSKRFIEDAKPLEVDESGDAFKRAMGVVVPSKDKPKPEKT